MAPPPLFLDEETAEQQLKRDLLVFATGLIIFGTMLWLLLYWQLGPRFSATAPFVFQILLAGNLLLFLKRGHFDFFRYTQLALFLFAPFVLQWSIGNFVSASGASLWALLAPIGAVLIFGTRESLAWFAAYLALTLLTGIFDFLLADSLPPISVSLRTSVFFFALNFAAISTIVFLLLRYASVQRENARKRLQQAHQLLQQEQARSERLLLNILPAPVAERLKQDQQTIADGFADVSVMFVDIVDFTRVAEGMTPQEVFSMLNRIFSSFDELAEKFGLERIKTIGDAYMVAGGLNDSSGNYTRAIADLALAIRELLQQDFSVNDHHLQVRIGIGTGPVVAGVVGKKKFIYDLWGDTVNLASRITGEGAPGMIQIDQKTWQCLHPDYLCSEPQTCQLKGKGSTPVYHLKGRQAETDENRPPQPDSPPD